MAKRVGNYNIYKCTYKKRADPYGNDPCTMKTKTILIILRVLQHLQQSQRFRW
jgi:hypothetical protein